MKRSLVEALSMTPESRLDRTLSGQVDDRKYLFSVENIFQNIMEDIVQCRYIVVNKVLWCMLHDM